MLLELKYGLRWLYILSNNKIAVADLTPLEKIGAIIGQVVRENGNRIPVSKYNRYAKAVGLDTLKRDELVDYLDMLTYNENSDTPTDMYRIYKMVLDGGVQFSDIFPIATDKYLKNRVSSSVITEMNTRNQQREFKALQKNGAMFQDLIDNMTLNLKQEIDEKLPPIKVPKIELHHNHKAMLINAADWHIGNQFDATAPGLENKYDYAEFLKRWYEYLDFTIQQAKDAKIDDVYLIHLGDIVEGVYMRPNQGFFTEFDFSTQVTKAEKVLIDTLHKLGQSFKVHFGMIIGNHDRIFTKKDNLYGDGVTKIIMANLRLLSDTGQLPNVEIIDNGKDVHDINLEIEGSNLLFTHGEKIKRNKNDNLSALAGKNKPIDYLFYAHYHDFHVTAGSGKTWEICCPALKGWDNYSKSLGANNSAAGQLTVIFEKGKTPQILPYLF